MRLLYRAYNVTSLLASGANAAGVRLGFCHYGYIDQAFCVDGHAMRDTCRGFVMRLSIVYADGKTQDVLTTADGSGGAAWRGTTAGNPMVYSHLYHGEVFDARMVQAGWDEPGFEGASAAKGWGAKNMSSSLNTTHCETAGGEREGGDTEVSGRTAALRQGRSANSRPACAHLGAGTG